MLSLFQVCTPVARLGVVAVVAIIVFFIDCNNCFSLTAIVVAVVVDGGVASNDINSTDTTDVGAVMPAGLLQ